MKRLKLFLSAAALVTSASFAQTTTLAPGTVSYTIQQDGKNLGAASYTVQNAPNKYILTSNGKMTESKFSYAFPNTQKIDTALNLITAQLNGVVSGKAVSFTATSDPTGRQFKFDISANGQQQTNTVDRNLNTVMLTDLDPAGYMLLTQVAMRSPANAWVLIPKENGFLVPVKFSPSPIPRPTSTVSLVRSNIRAPPSAHRTPLRSSFSTPLMASCSKPICPNKTSTSSATDSSSPTVRSRRHHPTAKPHPQRNSSKVSRSNSHRSSNKEQRQVKSSGNKKLPS